MKALHNLVGVLTSLAALTACAGGSTFSSAPSSPLAMGRERSAPITPSGKQAGPTLYVLNTEGGQAYSVSVYAEAGASFLRSIGLAGGDGASLAVDSLGHLYASGNYYDAGLLNIYGSRGAKLVQTLEQPHAFGLLTLDGSGNLFTLCAADRLCEYAHGKRQVLKPRAVRKIALRKLGATAYALAVDDSGNLAVSSRSVVLVFAPGQTEPYWKISGINAGTIAFDSSGNLYVALYTSVSNTSVAVYAPGGTSPIRTITDGVFTPLALAFDPSGNLYVLNYGAFQNGECTTAPSVTVYAPGGNTPIRTITHGLVCTQAYKMALDESGDVYVANVGEPPQSGNVVVYPPGGSSPIRTVTQDIQNPFALGIGP